MYKHKKKLIIRLYLHFLTKDFGKKMLTMNTNIIFSFKSKDNSHILALITNVFVSTRNHKIRKKSRINFIGMVKKKIHLFKFVNNISMIKRKKFFIRLYQVESL